ncbi:MAG TPA: nucleotidyltransferase domain-containing protein [Phycisphaerae bacterium]|nr:nucleotidyltransferase domain-containing protein [Phycisphaerae bacterium]HNU45489.1 nucleotidyltransferase domain-containing protein [Phycisphaerae bacterium]
MKLSHWQQQQQPRIERELTRVTEALRRLGAQRVVVFGSHARGDFHEGSDVDLLVVLDTDQRFVERIERVLEVLDSEMSIQPLVYTPEELQRLRADGNALMEMIDREGRVLYDSAN